MKTTTDRSPLRQAFPKSPTGIRGFDDITGGGLPAGATTLVCGGPGCGKTLLAVEFIARGILEHGEPGVFVSFEEAPEELARNVASLGFDLPRLVARKKLVLDHVRIAPSEITETGEYDLEGLFIRLGQAIDSVRARRVALDTIEALFAGFPNAAVVRAELRRLFQWLKARGVTTVVTGERGEGTLTRHGMEEYVSDCVISLDHRVVDQVCTRRLRIVKYRGSAHGTNEYPFLIEEDGFSVWPVTSLKLEHAASTERISTGVPRLDTMLGGRGYFRGSSVLVSGAAGTGKSSVAASFADAVCRRGERCLFLSFEESPAQMARNMRSIGLDLSRWVKRGRLRFHAVRPTHYGLETHLAQTLRTIADFAPHAVVIDPLSSLGGTGYAVDVKTAAMRLVDYLKQRNITALMTHLTGTGEGAERSDTAVSSLVDTWIVLRDLELNGERNRGLHILKSRGMAHSNQVREFHLTDRGVQLTDVYVGPSGVLMGSARLTQLAREEAERAARDQELENHRLAFARKRDALASQIAVLESELAAEEAQAARFLAQSRQRLRAEATQRLAMRRSRHADASSRGSQAQPPTGGQP